MAKKYKVLDLFSGLGGFSLGLERTGHFETVAFCDNDKFSKAILDKHWKGIKVYDDVREITKEKFKEDGIEFPDIITGGFPCQPFSVAGKQKGTSDDRHLWPEMFRIIKTFKPRFAIGENVRGIVNIQDGVVFETVCTDLESEGYEVQPFNIPAAGVGAPHRRERIWFIAIREESVVNSDNIRFKQHSTTKEETSWRGTSATFESTSNVGNSKYNGSPISEIGREFQKNNKIWGQEEQKSSREFERTSRPNSERVGSGGTIGSEQYSERTMGREIQRIQKSTEISQSPRSNVVNTISNDEGREISRSDEEKRRIQEEHRTEHSTTRKSSRTSEVWNGDNRYEGNKNNVADTNNEGLWTCIGGSDNDHETESRSGRADRTRSESDVERHNSTSTEIKGMDVADTESIGSDVRGREQHQGERSGQGEIGGASSEDDANSNDKGLEGFREGSSEFGQINSTSESSDRGQTKVAQGWWSVEPNVGRVAHGVSGRVHRLKGLGNSIVPQIVEEIGKALIKAEQG